MDGTEYGSGHIPKRGLPTAASRLDPWDVTADLALGRRQPRQAAAAARALADADAARAVSLAELRQQAHDTRPGLPT